eukprot:Em0011g23a
MNADFLLDSVLASLDTLRYSGKLLEESDLRDAVQQGLASHEYRHICSSLCEELKTLNQMQECVSRISGPEDAESFQLELRGFLLELNCPHTTLADNLDQFDVKLLLLDFLLAELMASRLMALRKATAEEAQESHGVPGNLGCILKTLGMSKPPAHVKAEQMFSKLIEKTKSVLQTAPSGHISPGLVAKTIPEGQWSAVERMNDVLTKEYSVRREVLLTRCDVTIQSFKWSDKAKNTVDQFTKLSQVNRDKLKCVALVTIAQMLAAKEELLVVHRTGAEGIATSSIKKIVMGKVPDRGGRPSETRPPPEMPAFRQRTEAPPMGRRDGGGGGHGRGGHGGRGKRVQGGE